MKLNMNALITILIFVSQAIQASGKYDRYHDENLRAWRQRNALLAPVRPEVCFHKDLLATKVGAPDEAALNLSYTPRPSGHVQGPVNLAGFKLVPIVHDRGNIVHILGTRATKAPDRKKIAHFLGARAKQVSAATKREQIVLPAAVDDYSEAFKDAVRQKFLSYARSQALLRLPTSDNSEGN